MKLESVLQPEFFYDWLKRQPGERKPGEGWQISEQTHREIEAIERNQREARANMPNILVGAKEGDTP